MDRILVPLDGSVASEAILPRVKLLVRRNGMEIVLLRTVAPPSPPNGYSPIHLGDAYKDADVYLKNVEAELTKDGFCARSIAQYGSPADQILHFARVEQVAIVAMATHGTTGISRVIMGSVTESVLRGSDRPLFLVRSLDHEKFKSTEEFRRILLPMDGSVSSLGIVPHVAELARQFKAQVTLLRIDEPDEADSGNVDEEALMSYATQKFEKFDVPVERQWRESGDPASAILDTCRQKETDLIAMATHGRKGVLRWVLGSVTENVLRSTPVPLFVVRAQNPARV